MNNRWKKYASGYVRFGLEKIDYKRKKLQGIFQTNMLSPLLFKNFLGSWNKERKYSGHYMHDHQLL